MSRDFDLDPTAAKDANSGGKRITEPGAYTGTIRAAWYEKNDKGTESVHLMFAADNGQEAGPLALYTHNGHGEPLPSYKTLNAIMACMKLRKLACKPGRVKLWDYDAKAEVDKQKDLYPELTGPKIGLVLQGEEYENRDHEIKTRLLIAAAFEPSTRLMADEILSKATEPKALDRFLTWFESNKLKGQKPQRQATPSASSASGYDPDSEIPF